MSNSTFKYTNFRCPHYIYIRRTALNSGPLNPEQGSAQKKGWSDIAVMERSSDLWGISPDDVFVNPFVMAYNKPYVPF